MENEMTLAESTLAALATITPEQAAANAARNIVIARELDLAERSALYSEISDVSKEVWGFRDRFDWTKWTKEELQSCLDEWYARAEAERAFEREQEELAKQDERDHVAAVRAAMSPTECFTLGDLIPL